MHMAWEQNLLKLIRELAKVKAKQTWVGKPQAPYTNETYQEARISRTYIIIIGLFLHQSRMRLVICIDVNDKLYLLS